MIDGAFTGSARFELRRRLGEGGMGVVYEAFDRERAAPVALKALRTPGPELLLRLKQEFRALQDVRHPNLVGMGELFEARGQWFFTMDLVDGVPFWDHVRPSADPPAIGDADTVKIAGATARGLAALDETRLREALAQLALGLQHLHQVGKVHRDVKPSNILVDREGRVVLVDFGLVASADERRGTGDVVGTVAYMAPEQAAGAAVGGAADWYALGVLLYEALTGQLPFDGAPLQILLDKQRLVPPPPHAIAPGVPADLDELALELLRFDPAARPSGATILARLGAASAPEAARTSGASSGFVGRDAELATLEAAAADVAPDHPVMVYVHGGSGVGKSALVARFTAAQAIDPAVVVLHGRCYEREAVPYKAVDGVVDALADYLQGLPRGEAAALLPRRAALLVDVFPVLGKVEVLAEAPRGPDLRDPQELRTRLFDAARELFARLCDRRRVVVAIDDLQWADPDSLALLAALIRAPEAPPLLLVATVRGPDDDAAAAGARLALPGDLRHLSLAPLGPTDARALAARLVGRVEGD
ncbi:MAG: serine/threonine-protein kinase PknK, partial [Deltaproteobacteria bacterium]|nr:serine/threonine-protein kinase PknK [Deltaproteobacteria bacterium]